MPRTLHMREGESLANLQKMVYTLFADKLNTVVPCVDAKRMQKSRSVTAPGIVLVQFEKKEHKLNVFKARGKLAGTKTGMDDDLTHLQQECRAWSAFQDHKANRVMTQWQAKKLCVEQGRALY